jgi:hypothetical protein
MKRHAKNFTTTDMTLATLIATRSVESAVARAHKLTTDPDKEARLQRGFCRACFYAGARMAGQAFTTQPCACCREDQRYSSTATDALCKPCADKHDLCKHCGGDRDMDLKREAL